MTATTKVIAESIKSESPVQWSTEVATSSGAYMDFEERDRLLRRAASIEISTHLCRRGSMLDAKTHEQYWRVGRGQRFKRGESYLGNALNQSRQIDLNWKRVTRARDEFRADLRALWSYWSPVPNLTLSQVTKIFWNNGVNNYGRDLLETQSYWIRKRRHAEIRRASTPIVNAAYEFARVWPHSSETAVMESLSEFAKDVDGILEALLDLHDGKRGDEFDPREREW